MVSSSGADIKYTVILLLCLSASAGRLVVPEKLSDLTLPVEVDKEGTVSEIGCISVCAGLAAIGSAIFFLIWRILLPTVMKSASDMNSLSIFLLLTKVPEA